MCVCVCVFITWSSGLCVCVFVTWSRKQSGWLATDRLVTAGSYILQAVPGRSIRGD